MGATAIHLNYIQLKRSYILVALHRTVLSVVISDELLFPFIFIIQSENVCILPVGSCLRSTLTSLNHLEKTTQTHLHRQQS